MLTGGVALALDACISLGILVEIIFLAMELVKLRCCSCLGIYQNALIHLLLLAVLMSNWQQSKAEHIKEKERKRKEREERGHSSSRSKSHRKHSKSPKKS